MVLKYLKNFRSISLLPIVSKIIEKVIPSKHEISMRKQSYLSMPI